MASSTTTTTCPQGDLGVGVDTQPKGVTFHLGTRTSLVSQNALHGERTMQNVPHLLPLPTLSLAKAIEVAKFYAIESGPDCLAGLAWANLAQVTTAPATSEDLREALYDGQCGDDPQRLMAVRRLAFHAYAQAPYGSEEHHQLVALMDEGRETLMELKAEYGDAAF